MTVTVMVSIDGDCCSGSDDGNGCGNGGGHDGSGAELSQN